MFFDVAIKIWSIFFDFFNLSIKCNKVGLFNIGSIMSGSSVIEVGSMASFRVS